MKLTRQIRILQTLFDATLVNKLVSLTMLIAWRWEILTVYYTVFKWQIFWQFTTWLLNSYLQYIIFILLNVYWRVLDVVGDNGNGETVKDRQQVVRLGDRVEIACEVLGMKHVATSTDKILIWSCNLYSNVCMYLDTLYSAF